jgi:glycosyltransferase involved in cell wall biosynthesis
MNVLFLTLIEIDTVDQRGLYHDLLRKFRDMGHNLTVVSPLERRRKIPTRFFKKDSVSFLQVKTFNIQKTNVIEKGIGTLAIEFQYLAAIKRHLSETKFDLVLYSTPPITFVKIIDYIKKRDQAKSYLLLKDIFPQNAVDMKMLKENGFLHKYFTKKEKDLYKISDTIGCMSQANVDFILKYNPEVEAGKVEVNPNSIQPITFSQTQEQKMAIRSKYGLPLDKKVFVYGGNLGIPQGVDFLIETIERNTNKNAFFLVIGNGTQFKKLSKWFETHNPQNALLLSGIEKNQYDNLLNSCDIGLIFLNENFTIPNFPSRLLSYLEMKMPVIAAVDTATDIGKVIEDAKCGYSVLAGDIARMNTVIEKILHEDDLEKMGKNGYEFLIQNYTVDISYGLIIDKVQ